jgi:hypothetical protein
MADYSPPYTEEDAKFDKRVEDLQNRIKELPLADLTVGELLKIIKVMQPQSHFHHTFGKADANILEKILD